MTFGAHDQMVILSVSPKQVLVGLLLSAMMLNETQRWRYSLAALWDRATGGSIHPEP
jgi:hypothetical protein